MRGYIFNHFQHFQNTNFVILRESYYALFRGGEKFSSPLNKEKVFSCVICQTVHKIFHGNLFKVRMNTFTP